MLAEFGSAEYLKWSYLVRWELLKQCKFQFCPFDPSRLALRLISDTFCKFVPNVQSNQRQIYYISFSLKYSLPEVQPSAGRCYCFARQHSSMTRRKFLETGLNSYCTTLYTFVSNPFQDGQKKIPCALRRGRHVVHDKPARVNRSVASPTNVRLVGPPLLFLPPQFSQN